MKAKRTSASYYHPDITIFLLAIPCISAINYYLTYSNIRFNWFLLLTFTLDTVQGYMAWWAVRALIIKMDQWIPYSKGLIKRICLQVLLTTLLGLAIISILTEITSLIAKGKFAPLNFYTIDLFIIGIWFFAINAVYIGLHYYHQWKDFEQKLLDEKRAIHSGLLVKSGKKELKVNFPDFLGFYVDNEYTVGCTLSGETHYLDDSLEKLYQKLPEEHFFRLSRQYIIHRNLISGFKRAENGKLLVLLKDTEAFPEEVTVSRTKAPAFKEWFRPV